MALKQVKSKIISTQKTGKVTKAMESVSAVKMRKSQEKAFAGRPFVRTALRILNQLVTEREADSHPLTKKGAGNKTLIVIVTSDKGLAGSVNSAVLAKTDAILEKNQNLEVICIGRKANEYALRNGLEILHSYTNVSDLVEMKDVYDISKLVVDKFKVGEYKTVDIIYQNFLSTFEQAATKRQVLPIDKNEITKTIKVIKPTTGKFSQREMIETAEVSYTIEPEIHAVMDSLIPHLVQIMIYHSLLESKASEHSARMVAMKNATDKSKEVIKDLTILYNKERQASITAEVSEITAGVEAMK